MGQERQRISEWATDGPNGLAWRMTGYQQDVKYIRSMVLREYGRAPSEEAILGMRERRHRQDEAFRRDKSFGENHYSPENDNGEAWSPRQIGKPMLHMIRLARALDWECTHHRTPLNTHRIGEIEMCRVCRRKRLREAIRRIATRRLAIEARNRARREAERSRRSLIETGKAKIVITDAQALINARGRLPLADLKSCVAAHFGLSVGCLLSKGRDTPSVHARAVVAQILHERGCSSPVIGRCLGGRDHSTIIHALRSFQNYLDLNPKVGLAYAACRDREISAQ